MVKFIHPARHGIAYMVMVFFGIFLLFSCNPTKKVPNDQYLLNKVKLKVDKKKVIYKEVRSLVRQEPNKRVLGIVRFHLARYNYSRFELRKEKVEARKKKKNKEFRPPGEPPVLYDSSDTKRSTIHINAYLKNKGYYDNKVTYVEKLNRKKANVVYEVELGQPTLISEIEYNLEGCGAMTPILQDSANSLLKVGDPFDIDNLEKERKRITAHLLNEGYYFFSKDLLYFTADTLKESKNVHLKLEYQENPVKMNAKDTVPIHPYRTYRMNNIYVRMDYDPKKSITLKEDTIYESGYYFIGHKEFRVKPKTVSRAIFFSSNDYYLLKRQEDTYRRLSALNNFQYINITFVPVPNKERPMLDCIINMSPTKDKSISLETNGTNTGGNLGVNGTISYQHRNKFRGAELLKFKVIAGVEAQNVSTNQDDKVIENTPFNTVEFGPELSLEVPKFMVPFSTQDRFAKRNVPKTFFLTSYNYQNRPDYERTIFNVSFGYRWKESASKSHQLEPLNLSVVEIDKSPEFQDRLDSLGSSTLRASYNDHFIWATTYSYILNSRAQRNRNNYHFFRLNVEPAGNLLWFMNKNVFSSEPDENGNYRINNIVYAQYLRTIWEYSYKQQLKKESKMVYRTFIGLGFPYGNIDVMPFEKSFYAGGSNGIRAWQSRSLGPGSLSEEISNTTSIDQIGDIKFEGNIEFRFDITRLFEGAVFTDYGNIWLLQEDEARPGGKFEIENFWQDMAIGLGAGLRLDFNYFVIRLDVARRVKDPGSEDPREIRFFHPAPPVYNFGIGYPF